MHAIGMGGWLGIFLIIFHQNTMLMTWPLASVLVLTGLVCTSRLILSNHEPADVYGGLLLGIVSQLVAALFL